MAGDLRVVMRSLTAWPSDRVFVATDADWTAPIECVHETAPDQWAVSISTVGRQTAIQLKFLLAPGDGQPLVWQDPPGYSGNLRIEPDHFGDPEVRFDDVQFPAPPL